MITNLILRLEGRIKKSTVFFILLFLCVHTSYCQDSIKTVIEQPVTKEFKDVVKDHDPNKALILSAVLPGAGQVYNKQAYKVPIVYALLGGGAYFIYDNYTLMKKFKTEYLYRVQHDDTPQLKDYSTYPTPNIYNLYESYNKNFQLSIIVTVALYGVNLLDAYVFGHLFDFQMSDDISLNICPSLMLDQNYRMMPATSITLRV